MNLNDDTVMIKILTTENQKCVLATAQPNNSMDVRAKQRLCYLACLFSLKLRGGGFAPRHLNRYAASLKMRASSVLDVQ